MSEISYTPPPPPPPTPPVQPASPAAFDFTKPFAFVFEDPRWMQKILVGGLFYLAGFLIIGWFFILGYCWRLAQNVMNGVERPLPEWDDLGDFFNNGLRMFGIVLVYILPIIVLAVVLGVPAAIAGAVRDNEGMQVLSSGIAGCMACLIVPVSLAITFLLPAAMLRAVSENRMGAAFEIGPIWKFIRENIGNYLLAVVVYIIARFLAGLGIILLCIGVIFTGFWSLLIQTHAFAQVYRFREK
jgi:hypothetical protein